MSAFVPDKKFLKMLRVQHGLSQRDAAERAGRGMTTWTRYESGARMRMDIVFQIAKAFGVTPQQVAPDIPVRGTEAGNAQPPVAVATHLTGEIRTEGVARASSDQSIVAEQPGDYETERFGDSILTLRVHGSSMEPVARDGQRIAIDTKASVGDGDLAVVHLHSGQMLCKRWFEDRALGVVVLESPNKKHRPVIVRPEQVFEAYQVVGVLF